eukprot:TRINITY_DN10955_c0_g1_i2.p1 TRINITY_DN10955_c0_g1~~TRINITY_DN10955_c0_g1_i2.p1  ORF type:complete len:348 (+),score=67.72 TRINITY_DN10955_c0_g1_i2:279-1322(+)
MDDSAAVLVAVASGIVYEGSRRAGLQERHGNGDTENETVEITTSHSVTFPIMASIALLTLYYFFDKLQLAFIVLNILLSSGCLYNFLEPLVPTIFIARCRPSRLKRTLTMIISGILTAIIVVAWVVTNHPLLLDILGSSLCIFMLSVLRLNNAKAAVYLGAMLLLYDVFWVFISPYFFQQSVMVAVARQSAANPLKQAAASMGGSFASSLPKLDLPVKLVIPSHSQPGRASVLGLGDIVLPGAVVCYASRLDAAWNGKNSINYSQYALAGYVVGLAVAIFMARYFALAQPALLYLVPSVLGALLYRAHVTQTLGEVWEGTLLAYTRLDMTEQEGDDGRLHRKSPMIV